MLDSSTVTESELPFITVIIAVYNGELHLNQTLQSIFNQIYKEFEVIVIDGGSKDKSVDIIKSYSLLIDYWESEHDYGIYHAWNKGLAKAKGDWICFIGCDDFMLPDALSNYANFITSNMLYDYDFISSKINLTDMNLNPIRPYGKEWRWDSHKVEMRVAHVGALHSSRFFSTYGIFNDKYKIAGDYELLLRPKKNLKAAFMDRVTVLMRSGGTSSSNKAVFSESLNAKVHTAERNKYLCLVEYFYLRLKFEILTTLRK